MSKPWCAVNKPCNARSRHAGTIAGAAAALFAASYAPSLLANPTGAQVVSGTVNVNSPGAGQMKITQQTPKAIVNWNTFSIGANESVTVAQPSASSALLNRVVGNDASVIAGRLQANGKVFLVNPAGVIFTPGSSVNVGSMIASTLNISNADFLAGNFHFVGKAAAPISNAGALSAQSGGTIALLGGTVSNTGTVTARLGTVALGAGTDITLDFAGDGLTTLKINEGAANALIGNTGTLAADGGAVVMSAQTADALAGTVINQQGIVRAQSLAERNGHIVLDGGTNGVTLVSGTLDATGGAGLTGGKIDVTGYDVALLANTRVDASGAAGGGSVRFGGGAGGADKDIRNANAIWMAPTAEIHADALANGNGGHVVAYSDTTSRLYGTLSATGGAQGGDGGLIETSGHYLDANDATIDASAAMGKGGTWLLDPFEVNISFGGAGGGGTDTPGGSVTFGPVTSPGTQFSNGTINGQLNKGTSVTISVGRDDDDDVGDININAPILKSAGDNATLTLSASGSVSIGYSIASTVGTLGVELDANVGNFSPGSTVSVNNTSIATNGGNLAINGGPVTLNGANISTQAGNVAINGVATTGNAVAISYSLIATTTGNVGISGTTSGPGAGLTMSGSSVGTQGGSINASGSASDANGGTVTGVSLTGGFFGAPQQPANAPFGAVFSTQNGGSISINGVASGQIATGINLGNVYITTSDSATTAGGIALSGSIQAALPADVTGTASGTGVSLVDSSLITNTGNITVGGSATGPDGVFTTGITIDSGFAFTNSGETATLLAITSSGGAIQMSGSASGTPTGGGFGLFDAGISSTTGSIALTGGATGLTGTFVDGVSIFNSTLNSTGGNITVSGTVSSGLDRSAGIDVHGSSFTSSSGNIKLTGQSVGAASSQASVAGVMLENGECDCFDIGPTTIATGGNVSVFGSGTGTFTQGVLITDGTQITSSNGGLIDIRGAVTGLTGTSPNVPNDAGVLIYNSGIASTGATGSISIAGSTNTSDPGVLIGVAPPAQNPMAFAVADVAATNVTIGTTNPGSIALRAFNNGTTSSLFITQSLLTSPGGVIAIAPASVDPTSFAVVAQNDTPITLFGAGGGLSIDPQTFATFASIPNIVLGSSTHTGAITVNGNCATSNPDCAVTRPMLANNLTLSNPGGGSQGITLPFGISMPGQTLTLISAGPVTDPGGIQATSLLLSGPGNFTLNDPQNAVGTLALVNAGNVNFLNSGSFVIGPVTSQTYDSTTGAVSTVDGTQSTLTGNLVAQAATGSVGLNTNLSAGGSVDLVMENGVFTSAGPSTLSAGNAWRVWTQTWNGETRGNVQPNTAQPNFYGCMFGVACSWGGLVPTTGNHFVYVERPTLTVTADGKTRIFGAPNPTFTYTVTGLVNGDTATGVLNGNATSPATMSSPVGTYPIDPNFASRVGYVVNEIPASLIVTQPPIFSPFAQSGLQSFFSSQEQTFVYENNLQGTNICIGSNQPLFTTAPPGDTQDILAVEWKRVRSQPNLNSCMLLNGQHGCGDF